MMGRDITAKRLAKDLLHKLESEQGFRSVSLYYHSINEHVFIAVMSKILLERNALREALQLLYDHQNGCPLPSYEREWNEAMKKARKCLKGEDDACVTTPN